MTLPGLPLPEGPEPPRWYGVRCLFRSQRRHEVAYYEERITLWSASGFEQAIVLAEAEALEYAAVFDDTEYLRLTQAFHIADVIGQGAEVFSLIRASELDPQDYLDHFFATGRELQMPSL